MSAVSNQFRIDTQPLDPPPRLLLGPGPSNAHPRVLGALAMPQVGHLDRYFLSVMDEIQSLLRYAWQTENQLTIPVSGTGSAAMESCFANLVEPGDRVLIAVSGYFGTRMVDMAGRYGAQVHAITRPWGTVFPLEELEEALKRHRPKLLGLVHAETSTGALQPIEALGALCRDHDCLLLVDTVTSLGGTPLFLDEWGVDAAYSGSQKCLNCPPGIAPVTFGPRAMAQLNQRKTPVANWYLDLSMVCNYWGKERTYHHTAPINMNYGLREALRLLAEEGLEPRWQRHRETVALLYEGLNDLGLTLHVEAPEHRIPALTTVRIPEGVDGKAVCQTLLNQYNIEIAGGLGELAGKVWRIGTMGFNARKENVLLLLSALKAVLHR